MTIKDIQYSDVEPCIEHAKTEQLVFCKHTKYIGLFEDNQLLAIAGVLEYKNKVVFKNDYVLPEHRRKGYHRILMNFRLNKYLYEDKTIEATCKPMSLRNYIRSGFTMVKAFKNGCIKVRKTNENI